jgi:hypothetical protein
VAIHAKGNKGAQEFYLASQPETKWQGLSVAGFCPSNSYFDWLALGLLESNTRFPQVRFGRLRHALIAPIQGSSKLFLTFTWG